MWGICYLAEAWWRQPICFNFSIRFFEELIARAYVMTEVKFLSHSMFLAVMVSTMLQTSFHFYQGVPAALGHAATFLLWSIFYAKTNRIVPVILAHLYGDIFPTMTCAFSYGR